MLNILQILFLIFGWIFAIKGLVIAALVIDSVFMVASLALFERQREKTSACIVLFIQITVFALSVVRLCLF